MHEALSLGRFDQEVRAIPASLLERRRWKIHKAVFPVFDLEFQANEQDDRPGLRLLMNCDQWDELPPSIVLQRPDGTRVLKLNSPKHGSGTGVFHAGPHPSAGGTFVCTRGSREYHTHPNHTADLWEHIKRTSGYDLGGIITRIWNAWKKDRP